MDTTTTALEARMDHPATVLPGAMEALQALGKAVTRARVAPGLLELMFLRAGQINGCSACVVGHSKIARKLGESEERIIAVSGWRDAPYYTDAERAALGLTEAATRLADTPDPVSDELWAEVAEHFDEEERAALLVAIGSINVWNRLNVVTHQVAGAEW